MASIKNPVHQKPFAMRIIDYCSSHRNRKFGQIRPFLMLQITHTSKQHLHHQEPIMPPFNRLAHEGTDYSNEKSEIPWFSFQQRSVQFWFWGKFSKDSHYTCLSIRFLFILFKFLRFECDRRNNKNNCIDPESNKKWSSNVVWKGSFFFFVLYQSKQWTIRGHFVNKHFCIWQFRLFFVILW